MLRLLHFSDVHVQAPLAGVPWTELAGKKLVGLAVLKLLKERRHRDNLAKLEALAAFAQHQRVDAVVCTGDHTALGTWPELELARRLLEPFTRAPHGLVAIPGNHDIYLPGAVRDRRFEETFADLLHGDLPELAVDGPWPLVRLLGDGAAVVAVNSARPNPQPWRSSGRVPPAQLEALEHALDHPALRDRFVVVATHYAPRLASGQPDNLRHGLVNAPALLRVCERIRRGVLLHGHVHERYHVRVPGIGCPMLGAGSATDRGREGLWLLELDGSEARAFPGRWDGAGYVLEDVAVQL